MVLATQASDPAAVPAAANATAKAGPLDRPRHLFGVPAGSVVTMTTSAVAAIVRTATIVSPPSRRRCRRCW